METQADSSSRAAEAAMRDALSRVDPQSFDWEAYEGTYRGPALIIRLMHIPEIILRTPFPATSSLELAKTALLRVLPHIRKTLNVSAYQLAIAHLHTIYTPTRPAGLGGESNGQDAMDVEDGARGEEEGIPDMEWVEQAETEERKENGRLEVERTGYMSNLIKESIRLTYMAFAQLYRRSGDTAQALRSFVAAREYSSAPSHHVELGVGILETLLEFHQPATLPGHISKLEAALERAYPSVAGAGTKRSGAAEATESASLTAADMRERREKEARSVAVRKTVNVKLRVARGLVALQNQDWAKAGREFGEIGEEGGLGEWEGSAISSSDLALLTAICTLATADRERIRRVLLDRASFRSAVDDSNRWLLDLVRAYIDADYVRVMALLAHAEPTLLLNPFLSGQTGVLLDMIRTRSMVQYTAPFSSVSIQTMGEAFGMTQEAMLIEVERLVEHGKLPGRIDLIDKVLDMRAPDARSEMFRHGFKTGHATTEATATALIRMRMHEGKIVIDPREDLEHAVDREIAEEDAYEPDAPPVFGSIKEQSEEIEA